MQINLAEQVAITRTKTAIEEIRKAKLATVLLNGNYTDADYGSEPMSALAEAGAMLEQAHKTLSYALAVIEGRT